MLTGCSIWLHDSPALHDASLLISGGKIAAVGAEAQQAAASGAASTVACPPGGWLMPGIVDIHSHLGVDSYPEDWAGTRDVNEYAAAGPNMGGLESMVRALDAVDPEVQNELACFRSA